MTLTSLIFVATILVSLGKITDWFLRKTHKEAMLIALGEAEHNIKRIPFNEWAYHISNKVLSVYEYLYKIISGDTKVKFFSGSSSVIALLIVVSFLLTIIGVYFDLNMYGTGMPAIIALTLGYSFFMMGGRMLKNASLFPYMYRIVVVSSILSTVSLFIGANIAEPGITGFWFTENHSENSLGLSLLLALINLPFDFITISISVLLLNLIINQKMPLILAAILDIIISLVLSIFLYAMIEYMSSRSAVFSGSIQNGFNWFANIFTGNYSLLSNDQLMLTPLMLTTCVPVLIYMGTLLFVVLVLKPLSKVASYMCGLLSEKDNSPFFELATVISLFLGILTAISDSSEILEKIKSLF